MNKNNAAGRGLSLHPGGIGLTLDAGSKAGLASGDKVLDVGCGTGTGLAALSDKFGIRAYGLDISGDILAIARSARPDMEFTRGSASALPYPDAYFDAVTMECVLTLFDDPEAALKEASRVLKPGGRLIISALSFRKHENLHNTAPSPDDAEQHVPDPPSSCSADESAAFGITAADASQAPEATCPDMISCGLVCPDALISFARGLGFQPELEEDRREDLTKYMIESVMEYGSLEDRIAYEMQATGASVFNCGVRRDPKTTTYSLFIFRKQE